MTAADPSALPRVFLLPGHDKRVQFGHPWAYSNEIRMDAAAKANADAQALLAEYKAQLDSARAESAELVVDARVAGEKLREEIVARGRGEQEALLERARREIELEKERAVAELRHEAVELSLAAAEKLMERKMDAESDRKLVQDFLARIPAHKA